MSGLTADLYINIFSYMSYQYSQQVSRVNSEALIASRSRERAESAAKVIQRAFRRWKVLLRFAKSIESKTDIAGRFPVRWQRYLQTKMGKDFGKRLFKSYFYKFIYRIQDVRAIKKTFGGIIDGFFNYEFPTAEENERLRDVYKLLMRYDLCASEWHLLFWEILIQDILFPYIDREGAEVVFHTKTFFGRQTPFVWSRVVQVNWFDSGDWLKAVFGPREKYTDVFPDM